MKVLKSNVLCKEIESENSPITKIGDFVIPDSGKEYIECEVISIGEEVSGVSIGDKIYIYPKSGKEVSVDGEKYRVINISEIILVL